jgi:hypothetical protein
LKRLRRICFGATLLIVTADAYLETCGIAGIKIDGVTVSTQDCSRLGLSTKPASESETQLSEKIKVADKILAGCSRVPAVISEDFYRATVRAANDGDGEAQLCYLNSVFDVHRHHSAGEIDEFKAAGAIFADEGIERGDWRIVTLLGSSQRKHPRNYSLRSLIADGKPSTVYKMNRLLRVGADDSYGKMLDLRAIRLREDLSKEEVTIAESWAAQTFAHYFLASPMLTDEPTICESR